jgi:DNA polymerase (family X)
VAGPSIDKREVARIFAEIAQLLQLKGENPFKVRAYETAAQRISDASDDLATMHADGRLARYPGIGEALYKKIVELLETGRLGYYERLRSEFPRGVLDLLRIPDIGPKRVAQIYRELEVGSLDELRKACEEHRVRELKGFGEKLEEKILQGIARVSRASERQPLADVREVAMELAAAVRAAPGVVCAEVAGSARRWKETVNDVDIIVAADDPNPAMDALDKHARVGNVIGRGDTKCSVLLRDGLQVDLRVVKPDQFWTALHHFTGSKEHNVRLRSRAVDRGLHISEYAVTGPGGPLPIRSEEDIYRALDMTYVPPELREDHGEVEASIAGKLPDLVEEKDIRGAVHAHTKYSDGSNTIEEMARAAEKAGLTYLAVTDHSRSAGYAGGLPIDDLKRQWEEIDQIQERVPKVKLLKGSEVDILEDGRLDYPDDVLEKLDVVIVSVHSRFQMDEKQMTQRIQTALDHPLAQIWGHPTGRKIGGRPPYALAIEDVLDRAAKSGVAIEVNGNPHRLDLDADNLRLAKKRSLSIVLSVDAHSIDAFAHLSWAVANARRGWVEKRDVLNCRDVEGFRKALRRHRDGGDRL